MPNILEFVKAVFLSNRHVCHVEHGQCLTKFESRTRKRLTILTTAPCTEIEARVFEFQHRRLSECHVRDPS